MRKILSVLLIGLGAFLVGIAVLGLTWVPGQVERTPLDTDNVTSLSGDAKILDGLGLAPTPVRAWSTNVVDTDKSDDDVASWMTSLCLVRDEGGIDGCVDDQDPAGRLISAEVTLFATDRRTAETVPNGAYVPEGTPQLEGLQNKWPFDAEKKTYAVWDDVAGSTLDAEYQGTEEIDGLEVYVYEYTANVGPVVLVGEFTGTYFATYTFYVEPRTGAIINQVVHQERVADGVTPILELDLAFTDEQVEANVEDAEDARATLELLEVTLPTVGFAVGIPLLLIGFGLTIVKRRGGGTTPASASAREPASV